MSQELFKSFVANVQEYKANYSEEVANNLQRCLQMIAASSDLSIFNPGSREVVDFFVNLYEFMLTLDVRSNMVWTCISTLQEACKNQAMRESLIHVYKFTPILTKILSAQMLPEKRLMVLHLLQELTYGIKISWQESHLKLLISTLTSWIGSNDEELTPICLGVLVNICYKNLPSIYMLMKTVDFKKFLRLILNLQKNNDQLRMQVSKLLIALECVSGGLPEPEVKSYVQLTCPSLIEAMKSNDSCYMRHIFSYFQEIMDNPKVSYLVHDYKNYGIDVSKMLECLRDEEHISMDCLSVLFEFLSCLVAFVGDRADLLPHLSTMVEVALRWVRTQGVSTQALALITSIVAHLNKPPVELNSTKEAIIHVLAQQIDVVLLLLDMGGEGGIVGDETYVRYSALLKLLGEIMEIPDLAPKLVSSLNPEVFHNIFSPLLNTSSKERNNLFQQPVYIFYVQALSLLTVLSNEAQWYEVLHELIKEKQIHMVLAIALYTGPEHVKRDVLTLLRHPATTNQMLSTLSQVMADMNKLMMFAPTGNQEHHTNPETFNHAFSPMDMGQLMTLSQEGYLNSLLSKFEKSIKEDNCTVTSSIMELYQYKMASMSHTMRAMEASQEAADARATKLQHCLALTSAEVSRLHQLLQVSQQQYEVNQSEINSLKSKFSETETQLSQQRKISLQLEQNLASKTRIISEQNTKLSDMEITNKRIKEEKESLFDQLNDATSRISILEKSTSELTEQTKKDLETIKELTKSLETSKSLNCDNKRELDRRSKTIESLKKEILTHTVNNQNLEKMLSEKEKKVNDLNDQLSKIFELASSRKK